MKRATDDRSDNLFTLGEVLKVTGGRMAFNSIPGDFPLPGVSIDTRTIKPEELFIPIVGENYDGHDFIDEAFRKGASYSLTSRSIPKNEFSSRIIKVDDTLKALQRLAGFHRARFPDLHVIGITGSNGKSSVKDMIHGMLSVSYNTLKTPGNLNNEIGLPLTLLSIRDEHEAVVAELAMRAKGEIYELARLLKPEVGVITTIAETHIEFLGSLKAIAEAKAELLECLPPDGCAILPADSPYFSLLVRHSRAPVISFGSRKQAHVFLVDAEPLGLEGWKARVRLFVQEISLQVPFLGKHNLVNILAAVSAARFMGIDPDKLQEGINHIRLSPMRLEIQHGPGGIIILNDAYNASPNSTKAALATVRDLDYPGRKIAVLGDMLELGHENESGHRMVGELAAISGLAYLITIGESAKIIAETARKSGLEGRVFSFPDKEQALEKLISLLKPGDLVLFKSSRKLKLETIVKSLIESGEVIR
ncbi:MAG: UDP-N-acetylmuramoyl-tripeptide--D-alanyl-D-alanine ligase [Candidatus Eremiobacteraeota bacterium]|nr:UDP-N-acetylmuramoyl-tripeptide--D-alanyl-D-alanine ligase [Candidatus Eremiobacteraeota bacterium]